MGSPLALEAFYGALSGRRHKRFLDDETLFKNSELEAILRLFVRVERSKLREAVERSYLFIVFILD